MAKLIIKSDAEYISSGSWMCKESPTGAHHWIEIPEVEHGLFLCRHCKDTRKFPVVYYPYNV